MSEPNDTDILMNGEEWFAKNRGKLINITLVILIGVVGWNWFENSSSASSVEAESALVNVLSSDNTNLVEVARLLNGVHESYKNEPVAERALILSANTSVEAGDYQNAKARFSSYLVAYKDGGKWIDEAKLGQALCQEAVGENAPAIAAYQKLTNSPNTFIKVRASALLEAAQTTLEPLPSRPDPVEEPAVPAVGVSTVPATPSIEATPATPPEIPEPK